MICVDLNKVFPLDGNSGLFKNGCHRTGRFTSAAVDAFIRIDKKLLAFLISFFTGGRMDTVNGANIYTRSILHANAWLGYNIGHDLGILPFKMC
jgi:hypothetical protein